MSFKMIGAYLYVGLVGFFLGRYLARRDGVISRLLWLVFGLPMLMILDIPALIWLNSNADSLVNVSVMAYVLGIAAAAASGILRLISLRNIPNARSESSSHISGPDLSWETWETPEEVRAREREEHRLEEAKERYWRIWCEQEQREQREREERAWAAREAERQERYEQEADIAYQKEQAKWDAWHEQEQAKWEAYYEREQAKWNAYYENQRRKYYGDDDE